MVPTVLTTIVKTGSLLEVRTPSLTPMGSDGKLMLGSSLMSVLIVNVTEHIVPFDVVGAQVVMVVICCFLLVDGAERSGLAVTIKR